MRRCFKVEDLVGLQVLVIVNLELKKMKGLESQGMILMAVEYGEVGGVGGVEEAEEKVTLLVPQNQVPEGTGVE